jgi:hypothetical protein
MPIANPKSPAVGLPNLEPTGLVAKLLASVAIALVFCVGVAAPASAASCAKAATPAGADSDPFRYLDSRCKEAPPGSLEHQRAELDRGLRDGLTKGRAGGHDYPLGR